MSHSTDGGISWHSVTTLDAPASSGFVSPSVGYLNGRGSSAVLLTTDGGQTWTPHSFG